MTTGLDSINNSYCKRPLVEEKQITHTLDDIDPDLNLLCHQNDILQYQCKYHENLKQILLGSPFSLIKFVKF